MMKEKTANFDIYRSIYIYLVVMRIILVLLPQIGYIHPDEYFQAIEVLTGNFLDVANKPPWEFQTNAPIRSMTIPYFTMGMSIKLLKDMNYLCKEYLSFHILTPYTVLIVPRLLMCFCSFIVDYCLLKICTNNNEKYKSRIIVLASSYVMIVFGTRTFSNTIEMVLFAILLYLISESLIFSKILTKNKEYVNFRYEQSKTSVERAKFHKLRLYLVSDSYRNCWAISTVTVFGFFNRPTFLAFAFMPTFFWLYRGIGTKTVNIIQFYTRMLVLALCAIPTILTIVLIDSFFYGFITWGEIGVLEISINNFVFTPLNFLRYNMNSDNLVIHGLHPRFVHTLINIPLLFNVLGIIAAYTIFKYLYWSFHNKINLLPSIRTIKCLMTLSAVVPVLILSLFPHQEARFLIPLLLPLVYLHGMTVLPEADQSLTKAPRNKVHDEKKLNQPSYTILKVWLFINTLLIIFYGFLHQGGVFQATSYFHRKLQVNPLNVNYHIVTSYMYSLPESFFMQPSRDKVLSKGNKHYSVNQKVYLYEEGSNSVIVVIEKMADILKKVDVDSSNNKNQVYLLIPSSLSEEFEYLAKKYNLSFELENNVFPHLSLEAFPHLFKYCIESVKMLYGIDCDVLQFTDYIWYIFNMLQLNFYKISVEKLVRLRNVSVENDSK